MRHSPISTASFLAGCAIALTFSWIQLSPIAERFKIIPTLLAEGTADLKFACYDSECESCLEGVQNTPQALVFTGGSSFRFAFDMPAFAAAMPRPVVNCIRNDSRADAYQKLFEYQHVNQPGQVVLHGYNSWAVNSPGTWVGDVRAAFFVVPNTAPKASRLDRILLYAHLFFTRGMTESTYEWRQRLALRVPGFAAYDVALWPLSKREHQRRRIELMRRSFGVSAYARSFMIDGDRQRPAQEIAERHERLLATLEPSDRVVFFPAPELTEALPDRVREVSRVSRQVLLETLAKHPSVRYVDVDYRACGVTTGDFWFEPRMYFDIPHANPKAASTITSCLIRALHDAGLDDFLAAH